ncbi:vestitone reductase-like [Neltuma alba]|uniref:vestitone reductase-like n=1 Tax=Neltuma alba TaxID=207710 RepID=UPI0010A39691|nr:vestitone reductase-like [Prosopis alba]
MEEGRARTCVTGGTGFIACWIIKRLLEDGYSVNATSTSSSGDTKGMTFLTNLPGACQKLQLLKAHLTEPESFKEAIKGCIGVFQVASPMDFKEKEEDEEIVTKTSINGALGIMKACLTSNTVKRFVYTSSGSAVSYNGIKEDDDEIVMGESFWGDVDYLRTSKPFGWSYAISKTLAEKAVLEFGKENGLDVVTVITPFVIGPFICPKLPGSVRSPLYLLFGMFNKFCFEFNY